MLYHTKIQEHFFFRLFSIRKMLFQKLIPYRFILQVE